MYGLPAGISPLYFFSVIIGVGIVTILLRISPFIARRTIRNSHFLEFLGRSMPLGIMVILVSYTLISTYRTDGSRHTLYGLIALILTLGLHAWRNNPLLSIFMGTGIYMCLVSIPFFQ